MVEVKEIKASQQVLTDPFMGSANAKADYIHGTIAKII